MLKTIKKITHKKLFTTPSHSQKLALFSKLKQFYKYDISETDTHNPQEALKKSQERAAKIYGTKSTHYLTNGSTSGVIASVLTCTSKGDNVLLWDKAHQCHLNAVKLAGANPIFYELEKDSEWGIYKAIKASKLEQYLKQAPIKAVIVTSPSYYGVISDIKRIKEVCQKYNSYLIVDEAHGALYPFGVRESAIYQGADFIIQSLHKVSDQNESTN